MTNNESVPNINNQHNMLEIVAVTLFFVILLGLGVFVYQDYGLTWDDLAQVEIGELNYKYVFEGDEALLTFKNRYYGPVFEMLLYRITRDMADPQRFFMRHFLIFSLFVIGLFFFYLLGKRITKNWAAGLLGCVLIIASPRIFAHSFFNSKDIPFMAVFIIAIFTLIRYLDRRTALNAVMHALTTAVLIGLRAPGVLVFVLTVALLPLDILIDNKTTRINPALLTGLLYVGLTAILVILFWPILWHDPYHEFINALKQMSQYPWPGVVLYRGLMVDPNNLPWHYIPVWVLITTPLQYLVLAGCGFLSAGWDILANFGKNLWPYRRSILIIAAWGILPVAAVILLESVLYDGWRQLFFIYPAIILFAVLGLQALFRWFANHLSYRVTAIVSLMVVAAVIIPPMWVMVNTHPHQNVYFNRLGGEDMARVKRHFELDYWGLSYKQGLEYILANDPFDIIDVAVANRPGRINAHILPAEQAARLHFVVDSETADYFLTNYRYHPEPYEYPDEIFSIEIGNTSILSVFRLQSEN